MKMKKVAYAEKFGTYDAIGNSGEKQ